jgi:N-acetylneuraminic acid mutarotase
VTAVTDSLGEYSKFYRAPEGIPMTARGDCPGGSVTNTRSFVFGSLVTVDLETDGPPPPDTIVPGWNVLAPVSELRNYAALVAVGGKVYSLCNNTNRTVYRYDPATNAWSQMTSSDSLHQAAEGVVLGGRVWAIAGRDSAVLESYDVALNSWSTKAALTWPREAFGAAVLNGRIVAVGGCRGHWEDSDDDPSLIIDHVEHYDPTANAWTALAPLPAPRAYVQTAVVDGVLYGFGGTPGVSQSYTQEVLTYSPLTNAWTARDPMPVLRYRGACAVLDGEIWYTGGTTTVPGGPQNTSTVYIYNPANGTWRRGPDMPSTRTQHGAVVAGGVLYVCGGADGGDNLSFWAYRPE